MASKDTVRSNNSTPGRSKSILCSYMVTGTRRLMDYGYWLNGIDIRLKSEVTGAYQLNMSKSTADIK